MVNCRSRSQTTAWAYRLKKQIRSLMHSLRPNLKAQVWDWQSLTPSWNRMVGAYGPPRTPNEAQLFTSHYPLERPSLHDFLRSTYSAHHRRRLAHEGGYATSIEDGRFAFRVVRHAARFPGLQASGRS